MAKTLKIFPKTYRSKYPLEKWFNGEIWELEKDVDFHLDPWVFSNQLYDAARTHGHKVRIRTARDRKKVVIQAIQIIPLLKENNEKI